MIGNKKKPWFYLAIATLLLGVFFRLANLDAKVYWGDEVYTSLRLAGYTLEQAIGELFDNQPKTFLELQQYQRPHPEKGLTPTIKALAIEDSQHPPLYYTIAWFWEHWFGSAIAIRRTLPALISLLVFPCLYALCGELFATSPRPPSIPPTRGEDKEKVFFTGKIGKNFFSGENERDGEGSVIPFINYKFATIALALVAVSPFHVLYAQEVREYSLWTVMILLSCWAFLKAIRLNTKKAWVIYAITLAIALYTYLFSLLIAIGQGIYILAIERRLTKKVTAFLLASSFGLAAFAPWLFYVFNNISTIQNTTILLQEKVPLLSLVQKWGYNLSCAFIDLDSQGRIIPGDNSPLTAILRNTVAIALAILVGYAIYFLCRQTPQRIWLFVLTLMGVTGMSLILPDLISGGIRSSATRYLVPCYLGIQIAVAYLLAMKMTDFPSPNNSPPPIAVEPSGYDRIRGYLWRLVAIALLSSSVASCLVASPAETWWNKYGSYYNPQVAKIINQAEHPLLISSGYLPRVLSLSYLLQPKVSIQFVRSANLSEIPSSYSDVFLYRPEEKLISRLTKHLNYKIEKIYQSDPVFQYLKPISQHSEIWISKLVKAN